MTNTELEQLRRSAHSHTDRCYGRYEPCGEHHLHDDTCGTRPLQCGRREEPLLVAALAEIERLRTEREVIRAAIKNSADELMAASFKGGTVLAFTVGVAIRRLEIAADIPHEPLLSRVETP